jgi:hypothetical protein
MAVDPARLRAILNNTGLQIKDNPTYQFLNSLLDHVIPTVVNRTTTGGGSTPGPTGPTGPKGDKGDTGFPGEDGTDGDDGAPGSAGIAGPAGSQGPVGANGPVIPPDDPIEPDTIGPIPGPQGNPGSAGATGAAGPAGPALYFLAEDGQDGEPGPPGAGIAGGGNVIYTGAAGSEPAANAGDLYLPNNGFVQYRYSGSIWAPWGPIFPLTRMDDSIFSWINQGGASVAVADGTIALSVPTNASLSIRARSAAAPATPYTLTVCFLATNIAPSAGNQFFGIGWADNSNQMVMFQVQLNLEPIFNVVKYTSPTALSAGYVGAANACLLGNLIWMRITDNGTSRNCLFSADGQTWFLYHTVGRTDFLTPTKVLFGASTATSSYPMGMTMLSWKVT